MSCSPVRGCREGSVHTLWHTSDSMLAVRSLTSLCLWIVKPPFGQDSSCSTENWAPQAQWVGTPLSDHPYLSASASCSALLCNTNLCSLRGTVVSQLEAPFSCASSIALCRWVGAQDRMDCACLLSRSWHCCRASLLAFNWASMHDKGYSGHCFWMRSTSGRVV